MPAGQSGSCTDHLCPRGSTDHDWDSSTPCKGCSSPAGAPTQGQAGPCKDEPVTAPTCQNGGTPRQSPNLVPRSCTDYLLMGNTTNGVYTVTPTPDRSPIEVYCDFEADAAQQPAGGGAWTLVMSSKRYAPNDYGYDHTLGLNTLSSTHDPNGIYDGFVDLVNELGGFADLRFSCTTASSSGMVVDLVYADVDWVRSAAHAVPRTRVSYRALTAWLCSCLACWLHAVLPYYSANRWRERLDGERSRAVRAAQINQLDHPAIQAGLLSVRQQRLLLGVKHKLQHIPCAV